MSSLAKTLQSSIILVLQAVAKKLVGLVSTLILARILVPEDFGLVAMATISFGLLEVLCESGMAQYLLSIKRVSKSILNTAFTVNLILKSFFGIVLFFTAPFIADFFGDKRLTEILYVFSLLLIVWGLNNPALMLLKRKQEYGKIVKMVLVCKVAASACAITIALVFESYWALVIGQFFAYLLPVVGSYIILPYRPKLCIKNAKEQWLFSSWVLPQAVLSFGRNQLDTLIVSKMFGVGELGNYHVMKYMSYLPTFHFISPLTAPLHAQLAGLKNNVESFKLKHNVSFIVAFFVACSISMFLSNYSEQAISIVLGSKWIKYHEVFALFSLIIMSDSIMQHAHRTLYIYLVPKIILFFEIASVMLLATLLLYKMPETLMEFAILKVSIDLSLSLLLFSFTVIKYTDFKSYCKVISVGCIFLLFAQVSLYVTNSLAEHESIIVNFILSGLLYSSILGALFLSLVWSLRNIFREAKYIYQLILDILVKAKNLALKLFER